MLDTLSPKHCLYEKCGREITQGQWGAEGDDAFAERLATQFCRAKCARLHGPAKKERPKPTLSPVSVNYGRGGGMEPSPKELPKRDQARLAYARSLPCALCSVVEGVHAHHENEVGKGSVGSRTSDRRTLPLCWQCHKSRHDHGREVYGRVDVEAVLARINEAYDQRQKA
jgi:hypothetical protein